MKKANDAILIVQRMLSNNVLVEFSRNDHNIVRPWEIPRISIVSIVDLQYFKKVFKGFV